MAGVLETIMAQRRADAAEASALVPREDLRRLALRQPRRSLAERLRARAGTCILAEIKKASPSAGTLRADYDPAGLARGLAGAGACALSVLTEPRHFAGDRDHLQAARAACGLPILRKDFLTGVYQVLETAAWGADVALLIVTALDRVLLREMHAAAVECGLDVLAEAHCAGEVETALGLGGALVGVNSRDLRTLKTDLGVALRLAPLIPPDRLGIAESGIRTRADVLRLEDAGYAGFLIGEALMGAPDPAARLGELAGRRPDRPAPPRGNP